MSAMPPLVIPVYFDFASTICYVTHRFMQRLGGRLTGLGICLSWRPIDVGRLNGWRPGMPVEGLRRDNALRIAHEFEVPVRMPGRWLDSRAVNAIALALAGGDKEPAWRERVWAALFEEGRDLAAPDDLAAAARDAGLPPAVLARAADFVPLEEETRRAAAAGINGVPTFWLDGWPFCGLQDEYTTMTILQRFVLKKLARDQVPRA